MSITAMKEFMDYTFEIALRFLMRVPVREKASLVIDRVTYARKGDYAELRGRHAFNPKFFIEKGIKVGDQEEGQIEGERLYLTWKELASDKFFDDVNLIRRTATKARKSGLQS